jgi:uncharacterized protein YjbJ (UPF0337 family)
MNKDKVTGATRELKGKVEKEVGKAVEDEQTQAHGASEQAKGRATKEAGIAEDKVKNVKNDVKRTVHDATR